MLLIYKNAQRLVELNSKIVDRKSSYTFFTDFNFCCYK